MSIFRHRYFCRHGLRFCPTWCSVTWSYAVRRFSYRADDKYRRSAVSIIKYRKHAELYRYRLFLAVSVCLLVYRHRFRVLPVRYDVGIHHCPHQVRGGGRGGGREIFHSAAIEVLLHILYCVVCTSIRWCTTDPLECRRFVNNWRPTLECRSPCTAAAAAVQSRTANRGVPAINTTTSKGISSLSILPYDPNKEARS